MTPIGGDVYFSLGEAISIIGIVVAAFSILKPRWRLNFIYNRRFVLSVVSLLVLGIFSAFTGFIFAAYTDNNELAALFQGLTFSFFLFAAMDFVRAVMWRGSLYKTKLSDKRKGRLVASILNEALFIKDEESLNAIISIVGASLDEVCEDIVKEAHRDDEQSIAAYLLDTFLGEAKIANHIAEKRIDFIYDLLDAIEKHKLRGIDAPTGIDNLLIALYVNPKSYLYQQVGYDGMTNYASVFKAIFENNFFLREHGPIRLWFNASLKVGYREDISDNPQFVKVFLKGFEMALKKFAYTDRRIDEELALGMHQLGEYAESISLGTRSRSDYDYFSPAGKAFHQIVYFTSHTFYWDVFKPKATSGSIPAENLNPPLDTDEYRENLSSAFCRLFTDLAESIVAMHDRDDYERMHVLDLDEVFVHSIGSYPHVAGLRAKILHMLWEKSDDNIKRGHFPVAFRALAIMLYWRHTSMPEWAKNERNKLIDTLRNDVKPRILRNELMANRRTPKEEALLPKCIVFDRTINKFYAVDANDNRTEIRKMR